MTPRNPYAFHVRPDMRQGLASETPLPTRLVSNEEFPPLPQTPTQRRVEDRILAETARLAPRLGLSRRDFLRSSAGGTPCSPDERGFGASSTCFRLVVRSGRFKERRATVLHLRRAAPLRRGGLRPDQEERRARA